MVVIKNIVNVIKMGQNVLHRVDVLVAKIQKTLIIGKKLEKTALFRIKKRPEVLDLQELPASAGNRT